MLKNYKFLLATQVFALAMAAPAFAMNDGENSDACEELLPEDAEIWGTKETLEASMAALSLNPGKSAQDRDTEESERKEQGDGGPEAGVRDYERSEDFERDLAKAWATACELDQIIAALERMLVDEAEEGKPLVPRLAKLEVLVFGREDSDSTIYERAEKLLSCVQRARGTLKEFDALDSAKQRESRENDRARQCCVQ